jgi:hypothetical protein
MVCLAVLCFDQGRDVLAAGYSTSTPYNATRVHPMGKPKSPLIKAKNGVLMVCLAVLCFDQGRLGLAHWMYPGSIIRGAGTVASRRGRPSRIKIHESLSRSLQFQHPNLDNSRPKYPTKKKRPGSVQIRQTRLGLL